MAGAKLVYSKNVSCFIVQLKHSNSKSIDLNGNIKIEDTCKLAGNLSVLN